MKLVEASSPDTLSDDVVEANVAALLRKLCAQPGLPNARFVPTDPDDLERFRGLTIIDAVDTEDRLHAGMDAWVDEQIAEKKGKPVIEKALNLWLAAMRRGAKKNRLRWALMPPDLSTIRQRVKQKETLDTQQQALLADYADCLLGAFALFQLQTAAMQSEVAQLDLNKAMKSLNHSAPYLLFNEDEEGKTANRRRASPVVAKPEVIRKWLPEIREWLNSVTESMVSKALGDWLTDLFGSKYTAHGAGRHTFKAQALAAAANPLHVAEIAGWATGGLQIGQHMVSSYGQSAIERSKQVQSMSETSLTMFAHLVEKPPANVVPTKKKAARKSSKAKSCRNRRP